MNQKNDVEIEFIIGKDGTIEVSREYPQQNEHLRKILSESDVVADKEALEVFFDSAGMVKAVNIDQNLFGDKHWCG